MKDIILIGGGGHAKSCIDVIEQEQKYRILGVIDNPSKLGQFVSDYEIIGSDDDIEKLSMKCKNFFISIGQIKSSDIRRRIYERIVKYNINFPNIISPQAYVSRTVDMGIGNIVMHNAFLNSSVSIGDFNILNTGSILEHDTTVGDFTHVSVATAICGTANIGDNCFIGAKSVVSNNIEIGNDIFIGASSFVNRNLNRKGAYWGSPVKYRDGK